MIKVALSPNAIEEVKISGLNRRGLVGHVFLYLFLKNSGRTLIISYRYQFHLLPPPFSDFVNVYANDISL